MASRPWSDDELDLLESYAEDRDWLPRAMEALPHRSVNQLRNRMQAVRAQAGMGRTHVHDGSWMSAAAAATDRLLEATLRVGVWS